MILCKSIMLRLDVELTGRGPEWWGRCTNSARSDRTCRSPWRQISNRPQQRLLRLCHEVASSGISSPAVGKNVYASCNNAYSIIYKYRVFLARHPTPLSPLSFQHWVIIGDRICDSFIVLFPPSTAIWSLSHNRSGLCTYGWSILLWNLINNMSTFKKIH